MLAQTRLMTQKQMQSKIDELKQSGTVPDAEVAEYDNIENVMLQLNAILSQADEYSLSFNEVSTDDNGSITRPVDLSFTASSYTAARSIINNLYQCPYRCAVSDISESAENDLATDGEIRVDLTVTFYEKTAK